MIKIVRLIGCALLLSLSAAATAQEAGTVMVKAGYVYFQPVVSSGTLSAPSLPGSQVNVGNADTLLLAASYMFTDHISAEFYAGIPLKHDLYGAGSLHGVGVIGTVKHASPTLFGQYHFFEANSNFRPYLGLGISYVRFYGETGNAVLTAITNPGGPGTTFSVKNTWGIAPQIGFVSWINKRLYIDFSINKAFVKSTTTLSTGQSVDTKLNPVVTQASLGYRF